MGSAQSASIHSIAPPQLSLLYLIKGGGSLLRLCESAAWCPLTSAKLDHATNIFDNATSLYQNGYGTGFACGHLKYNYIGTLCHIIYEPMLRHLL